MIVEALSTSIAIQFEQHDWMNGLARSMNAAIKAMPYPTRKFDGEDKRWLVTPTKANRKVLRDTYDGWALNASLSDQGIGAIDMDAPDVQEFLEQFN